MRQLFVPACVCLMTWSGATGSDPRASLDEFTGAKLDGKIHAQRAPIDAPDAGSAEPVRAEIPIDMSAAAIALETPGNGTPAAGADAPVTSAQPERIPLPPIAKPVVHRTREEVCETLTQAAVSNNLPVAFFINLLFQESRFQPEVVSSAGAQGVAQFMPETAASMGLDNPFDPLQAIPASARLLGNLVSQFGNLGLAAAAYNAGPKRVQDWLGRKSKLPEETKGYVKTITGRPAENWHGATLLPGQRLPRHAPCQESAGLYAYAGPATIPLPARSPLRAAPEPETTTLVAKADTAKKISKYRIALLEKKASAKNAAEAAKPATAKPVVVASADNAVPAAPAAESIKISKHGARVTAVIDMSKPTAKITGANHGIAKIMTIAAPEKAPATKVAAKTEVPKAESPKIAVHTKTADAVKQDAKAGVKPAIQQLAARKQHKPDKARLDKVAQR
jgi:hypothetical protein